MFGGQTNSTGRERFPGSPVINLMSAFFLNRFQVVPDSLLTSDHSFKSSTKVLHHAA
jgi:hypothetical protein